MHSNSKVSDLIHIADADLPRYKIHFAQQGYEPAWKGSPPGTLTSDPLDDYANGADDWKCWQSYRPKYNLFNREFIFALAYYRHEPDTWLFGGIWCVLKTYDFPRAYEVELTDQGAEYDGKMIIRRTPPPYHRSVRVNLGKSFS